MEYFDEKGERSSFMDSVSEVETSRRDSLPDGRQCLGVFQRGNYKGPVFEMNDNVEIDATVLKNHLAKYGYVLCRNVLPKEDVNKARHVVLDTLSREWDAVDTSERPLLDGVVNSGHKGILLTGYTSITHHDDVLAVLEGDELTALLTMIYDSKPATFNNKWVRVQGQDEFTDEHSDYYRFQRNALNMYTCWIPLGDYSPRDGGLTVCEGSHETTQADIEQYPSDSKKELPYGFDAREGTWVGTNYRKGDVVVFDIRTVHSGLANTSNCYRISMDTRWQPASQVPVANRKMFTPLDPNKGLWP